MELSDRVELPRLLFFVSTFCSKCFYNRQLLSKYLSQDMIEEINISSSHPLLELLQPRMAPTVVLLDQEATVLFIEEGVLHDQTVQALNALVQSL